MKVNGQTYDTDTQPYHGGWRSIAFLPGGKQVASVTCDSKEGAEADLHKKLAEREPVREAAARIVDTLLEVRDPRKMREQFQRALDWLRQRNPMGYAQMSTTTGWPAPSYVEEDPTHEWWTSDEAAQRLQQFKDAAHEGVKPGTPKPYVSPNEKHWPKTSGFPVPGDADYGDPYT